jgi:hypothetical protein
MSRLYPLESKALHSTALNSMPGWRTISPATGVPVDCKEYDHGT